ncbi:MAG: response regulator [Oligoflexia bacterium]|nr:response regulator [Oligoflexia bacterium]
MSRYKILVADDSLTIQKVVKIILDGKKFEIIESLDENRCISEVTNQHFDLILLDFNLSSEDSGYSLIKKIKKIRPKSKILVMYGAFDVINEQSLTEVGAIGKINKPFDSESLLSTCAKILQQSNDNDNKNDNENVKENVNEEEDGDDESGWMIKNVTKNNINITQKNDSNVWGIEIPPMLTNNKTKSNINNLNNSKSFTENLESFEIPPKMSPSSTVTTTVSTVTDKTTTTEITDDDLLNEKNCKEDNTAIVLPHSDDLEYPDMGFISPEVNKPKSKLIPIDELVQTDIESISNSSHVNEINEIDNDIEFSKRGRQPEKIKNLINLEDKIKDELSTDDFWNNEDKINNKQSNIGNIKSNIEATDINVNINDNDESVEDYFKYENEFENNFKSTEIISHDDLTQDSIKNFKDVFGVEEINPILSVSKLSEKVEMVAEQMKKHNLNDDDNTLDASVENNIDSEEIRKSILAEIKAEIKKDVSSMVESYLNESIKKHCQLIIEKIAWDVIPSTAETLIKSELQRLAQKK